MKHTRIFTGALAAALLLSAAPASAQLFPHRLRNTANVEQSGVNNGAAIAQNGQGNSAGVQQVGANNTAIIAQTGSDNRACVVQSGTGHNANVTQTGGQYTGVIQTNRGARPISGWLANRLCRR